MKKCMKCGGAMKKYAKGGSTMKTTVGSKSAKTFIAGMPNSGPTGPNYQGIDTMKKGGAIAKAKFGTSVAVKASCKNGMVRGADGKCVMERPKFKSGGSLKPVPSDKVGLAKLPTSVRNKMGYQKKGGSVNKK